MLKRELTRKAAHFMLILVPLAYYFLGKWPSLIIFASLATIIISLDFARRSNPKLNEMFVRIFGPILRDSEMDGSKLCGASWVALSACITFLLFKPEIAITAFSILIFSDGLAALIGKSVPSRPFFEKTISGSMSFFLIGIIVLLTCGAIFDTKTWFYVFGFFALFCVTIIEARPSLFNVDDGFTIPIGFSVIVTFFDLMWNYNY
jgi:dolichol kinase